MAQSMKRNIVLGKKKKNKITLQKTLVQNINFGFFFIGQVTYIV